MSHQPFPYDDIWDPVLRIIDAFGLDRCMWGTDWTRAIGMLTYEQGVAPFRDTKRLSESDKASSWAGRAESLQMVTERGAMATPMTMAEKILARAAGKSSTKAGEFLDCKLDGLMAYQGFVETHHNAQAAGLADGLPKVFDKKKVFLMVEHHQPATNLKVAERGVLLRKLAQRYELENFYDTTCGICHQMMVDKAHALPGHLVVGTDSHSIMYGALNCASTGIGETDSGYAFTFGELWFQVPESIEITLTGSAPAWPIGKDIMLYLAGKYGVDMALYKSIEFVGPGVKTLSMDNRFTMSDQGVEIGAKFAIFPSRRCDARVPRRPGDGAV
jgi:homoaconitase/3-isopropylmalate dehydratase large subunit